MAKKVVKKKKVTRSVKTKSRKPSRKPKHSKIKKLLGFLRKKKKR